MVAGAETYAQGRKASILLVDDKPENLVALAAVLEPLGHDLVQASSGHEALKLLLRQRFAVILLDVQMPGLDGFETARLIKERERTRDVPIIFVTALSKDAEHIFRGYSEGAVDYVLKPYEPEVLRSKVQVFATLWEKSAALEESEQRFRSAFANAPSGMALVTPEGALLQVNRALTDMLGASQAELVGTKWSTLVAADDPAQVDAELRALALGGRGLYRADHLCRRPDGSELALVASVSPAPGDGPARLILQVEDVTQRRRVERERAARADAEARSQIARNLQRISDAGLAHLTLDVLLPELLSRVVETLGPASAAVLLSDPETGELVCAAALGDAAPPPGLRLDAQSESLAAVAVREHGVQTLADAGADGADPVAGEAARGLAAAPLVSGGELDGVLVLASPRPDAFDDDDLALLSLVAERAALAISNARIFEREHTIVATLQRSLLPAKLPQLPGMAVAGRYVPGGPGTVVGGDWYDAIKLDGGRIGLVMGDVVGHGIDAAALMGELRNALRAYALSHSSPGEVLRRLDLLLQQGGSDRMATLIYAVVEPDWSSLRLASAGHPPPLLVGPGEQSRFLWGGRSTPLGADPSPRYEELDAEMPTGSTLILYTDGLVEVRGESLDAGLDRLAAASTAHEEPEDLCARLADDMLDGPARDDVAVLCFRNRPLVAERLRLTPTSDPRVLINVRRTLARWLAIAGANEAEAHAIELSCHEACANVVEHAFGFGDGRFELVAERRDQTIAITIRDAGSWRDPIQSDRGRGIAMMRAEMDDVTVTGGRDGTTVQLLKRLAGGGPVNGVAPGAASAELRG